MTKTLHELRKEPHWSFSSINGLLNICSLQWAFRYVYKEEQEITPINLLFGSAFHRAAEWITTCRMKGVQLKPKEVKEVFAEHWIKQCQDAWQLSLSNEEFKTLNDKGEKMVECLNNDWTETDIIDFSKAFSVTIPGVSKPLIGEIDLVVKAPQDKTILVDWKTSAKRWATTKAEKDLQATCFMYAYEQITPDFKAEDNLFRYDVITKTKEPSYTQYHTLRTNDDFMRLAKLIRVAEKMAKAELFLPNEQGYYCKGCGYASACKQWHRKQAKTIFTPMAKTA